MKKLISLVLCLGMLMSVLSIASFAAEKQIPATASCSGIYSFGEINAAANVLDGDNTTVCGSGWAADVEQSITISFVDVAELSKVTVTCKDEGAPESGAWGTYDVYAVNGSTETKIGTIDATPSGNTITLDDAVDATGVKVVITSWNGTAWACVADIFAYTEGKLPVDRRIALSGAESFGFAAFGEINAPTNVLDGDNNSCCGSNWDENVEQGVKVIFASKANLASFTVSCKNEGAPASGAWGTYDIYAVNGDTETKIGTVDAYPEGRTVELDETVEADAVKIVITSWNGSAWAAIADVSALSGDASDAPSTGDATTVAIVFATVAILGMAVVVTKKVNA